MRTLFAVVRNSLMSSSYAPMSAKLGQAWMIRDHSVGSATAAMPASSRTAAMVTHRDQREDSVPIALSR
ncbi:hypothetical protein A9R04_09180 [Nocardiopsis dassonvillei]|nr:hypothetical protein A9R04_09180 [Nocardiopsis dassonvillei]